MTAVGQSTFFSLKTHLFPNIATVLQIPKYCRDLAAELGDIVKSCVRIS